MGHATHFLQRLERVEGPALSLALGLYRDPPMLKWVMARLLVSTETPTVALALAPGPEPPWLLVSRAGQFITCLGAGMQPEAGLVVSHSKLEGAVGELEAWRDVQARNAGQARTAVHRLMTAGRWLCREDLEDLLVLSAMYPDFFVDQARELNESLLAFEAAFRPRDYQRHTDKSRAALSLYWKHAWAHSHAALVATEAYRRIEHIRPGLINAIGMAQIVSDPAWRYLRGATLRTAWSIGRLGRPMLAVMREWGQSKGLECWLSVLGLEAVGLRHAGTRAEVIKTLMRSVPPELRAEAEAPTEGMHVRLAVEALRLGGAPAGLSTQAIGILLADHELATQVARADIAQRQLAALPGLAEPSAWTDEVEALVVAIPGLCAQHVKSNHRSMLMTIVLQLPAIARASAADLCLPRATLQRMDVLHHPVSLDAVRDHLERLYAPSRRARPVQAKKVPGRNEPCTCGSGKKYKACCGG